MNTLENNQLINDFIGKFYSLKSENYHDNWNDLMFIVEKIESLNFAFDIMGKACSINNDTEMIVDLCGNDFKSKIESVYTACVEFIQWYNLNNK